MVSKKIKLRLTDLIGKKIKVVDATNKSLIGIEGVVVDETKNLLIVETSKGRKKLLKEQITIEVDGQRFQPLPVRAWEIKKRWKKWRKLFQGEGSSLE